jgi:hypothetical protein
MIDFVVIIALRWVPMWLCVCGIAFDICGKRDILTKCGLVEHKAPFGSRCRITRDESFFAVLADVVGGVSKGHQPFSTERGDREQLSVTAVFVAPNVACCVSGS